MYWATVRGISKDAKECRARDTPFGCDDNAFAREAQNCHTCAHAARARLEFDSAAAQRKSAS